MHTFVYVWRMFVNILMRTIRHRNNNINADIPPPNESKWPRRTSVGRVNEVVDISSIFIIKMPLKTSCSNVNEYFCSIHSSIHSYREWKPFRVKVVLYHLCYLWYVRITCRYASKWRHSLLTVFPSTLHQPDRPSIVVVDGRSFFSFVPSRDAKVFARGTSHTRASMQIFLLHRNFIFDARHPYASSVGAVGGGGSGGRDDGDGDVGINSL